MKAVCRRVIAIVAVCAMIVNFSTIVFASESNSKVTVRDYEIKSELVTYDEEIIYGGDKVEVTYENYPSVGMNYLLVNVMLSTLQLENSDDFIININGQKYYRLLQDEFISDHKYEILPHGQIMATVSGWMLFEIPKTADQPETWTLSLGTTSTFLTAGDKNFIEQTPYYGIIDQQKALVEQHRASYAQGNYTPQSPFIVVNPYGTAPLTALIMFETEVPVEVTSTIVGKTERSSISNVVVGYNFHHEIPLIGLYNEENKVLLSLKYEDGSTEEHEITVITELIPEDIEQCNLTVNRNDLSKLSDGLYILQTGRRVAFDINGDIRGYMSGILATTGSGLQETADNGHFFVSTDPYTNHSTIYEFDAMGFVYRELQVLYIGNYRFLLPQIMMLCYYQIINS